MSHAEEFFGAAAAVCGKISCLAIDTMANELVLLRDRCARLFLIGVGGSAANCSHAAADFRKLCGIEAYSVADNVAELTARTNDEGWDTVFAAWLEVSRLNSDDVILVLSVGGGDVERNVSVNIIKAIDLAKARGVRVFAIVGRSDSYAASRCDVVVGDHVIVVPQVKPEWITPLSESFQALVWHCLVSHPLLQLRPTKW
jgi:D-sedoheptulose 7-phosphate isomerase